MKESKERMPLDERQGHTTRLQPGRRPTFAVVEGRNPFTHCDTIKDQQSGTWDATHKAWHVRFFSQHLFHNLLLDVNRLFRLPDDLWGHDDNAPCGDSPDRDRLFKALRPSTLTRDYRERHRKRDVAAWLWHERSLRSTEMRARSSRTDYNYLMQTLTILILGGGICWGAGPSPDLTFTQAKNLSSFAVFV